MFTDEEIEDFIFKVVQKIAGEEGEKFDFNDFLEENRRDPEGFDVIKRVVKEVIILTQAHVRQLVE